MEKKLDEILKSYVVTQANTEVRNKLLAAGFVVVDRNGVVYTDTAGRLDFDPSSPAYGPDSISWLASMSKLATAVGLLLLVERGIIGLDDDIRGTLPELAALQVLRGFDDDGKPTLEAHGRTITLRHLLSHTLGMGVDMADPDLIRWAKYTRRSTNYMSYTLEGITTPLKFAPGEGWYYGTAYDWAGYLLTKLTASSLSAYLQDNVFGPLGMESTTFRPSKSEKERMLAFAYAQTDEKGGIVLNPGPSPIPDEIAFEAGGSGLFSSLADYGRLLHGILAHKILSPETTDLLFASQLNDAQKDILMAIAAYARDGGFTPELPRDAPLDHGLGGVLNVEDVPGKRRKGSMMWSGATNGRWWIDRESGLAGAVFTQVEPHGNKILVNMFDELERTVYEARRVEKENSLA
ncbi:beta-lactamase/transpeptidase-like protein [Xylaria bambusicola]|uniref:beta-lactamase/transpeptidase-like protein n=1 Tax=Xylaria bambusicola TaxID=326684 RepID=UPI0020078A48|nr:beta-lactamase/transpeptidase-like protein [Xylaria bambusicola]KAI0505894.1 beta-lactamase/transpeptidase-like protein [Xylaria bambusicola]